MPWIRIAPKAVEALSRRHPWVFSGAVAAEEPPAAPGDTVQVRGPDDRPLASGAYSPASTIRVRVWSFDPAQPIDGAFFDRRIAASIAARGEHALRPGCACRLVHAESDGLPGTIVDRYDGFAVCQFLSAGAERQRNEIARAVAAHTGCRGVYERSEGSGRTRESLPERRGLLSGAEPPDAIEIAEGPCRFLVDVRHGHKTGFYLDQRENRARLAALAGGRDVLNCFAYTGGFGIAAAVGGARSVVNVESAPEALALLERNAALNGIGTERMENVRADVFEALRRFRDARRSFDLIVLDPPKFAASSAAVQGAARGYKDINLLAFKLLRPGGLLLTFSCSEAIASELFQKIVADAALDAGRPAQALEWLSQAPDHPVSLAFPEGRYLKGLVCRVQ